MAILRIASLLALLIIVAARSRYCASTYKLWGALLSRTARMRINGVPEEVIWCVHVHAHPENIGCTSVRHYKRVLRKAKRQCKKALAPIYVPRCVIDLVRTWARDQRVQGTPEEAICCVHGRVHMSFKGVRPYGRDAEALYAAQGAIDSSADSCRNYAMAIPSS